MRTLTYTITTEYAGKTILAYLKGVQGYSSKLITKLRKYPTGILLNGAHANTTATLSTGDTLRVELLDGHTDIPPVDLPLEVVYEDEDVLVVNKGTGVPVHPTRNHQGDTLANAVAFYLENKGIRTTFRAINRLDRDTCGAVVIALNEYAANKLQQTLKKTYVAVVSGVTEEQGTIDLPIARLNDRAIIRLVSPEGQPAITHYKRLSTDGKNSLVECHLETGRTHQIRVHFSHLGHPLLGDDMYGGDTSVITHQALQCARVEFTQPVTGEQVVVDVPLQEHIKKAIG